MKIALFIIWLALTSYLVLSMRTQNVIALDNVAETLFYNDTGLIASCPGDGNVMGDDGPYYKIVHFRDGSELRVDGTQYGTTGIGEVI